jgi:hypothetical protein
MTTREEQEKKEKAEKAYALTNDTRTVAGENMQHTLGAYAGLVQDDEEDRIYTPEEIERAREIGDAAILRAHRKSRVSYRSRKQQEAAYGQQITEEEGGIERQRANERQHALTQRMLQKQTIQKSMKASASLTTKGVVSRFGTTMSISASVVSYQLQFLFALLALVFLGASAAVSSIYDVAVIGTILKAVTKVISVFVDLEKYAPLLSFAFIFWGLSAIVAFSTYFAHCLLFSQLEREVAFGSAPMMGCAALTFALALVPILNILPWVQMWVVLITIRSSYRIVKEAIT